MSISSVGVAFDWQRNRKKGEELELSREMLIVFSVLARAAVLFVSKRVRRDLVGILVALALMVGGVLTVPEALAGFSEPRLVVGLMLAASGVGAFMSSTAVVANFVPVVLSVANKARLNLKRLLMALSVGVPISGMMTLIATAPNLAVQKALKDRGLENSGFFSFSSFGVAVLLLAIVFILLAACVNWRKSLIIN